MFPSLLVIMLFVFHSLEARYYMAEVEDGMEEAHDYRKDMSKMFRVDYPIKMTKGMKKQMMKGIN